jgi:hypothetical protein
MFLTFLHYFLVPKRRNQHSDSLQTGLSVDIIPVGKRFSAFFQTSHGAHPVARKTDNRSFPGVKRPGRGVDHPPPSKAEVTKRNKTVSVLHLWAVVVDYKVRFTFTFNTISSHMNSIRALTSYFRGVSFIVALSLLYIYVFHMATTLLPH